MNEKCAMCIHCEVCGFTESETAKAGACDFYDAGKTLDKIRAEVRSKMVEKPWFDFEGRERDRNNACLVLEALYIIDKYTAEWSGEE